MLEESTTSIDADEWQKRSNYWSRQSDRAEPRRPKRQRRKHPLILCGHGISMRIDRKTLLIRDGFTHYPQEQTEYRFFPGDLQMPERIIIVDGSGGLSLAVLEWLNEHGITLIRVNWNGRSLVALGGSGSFVDPEKFSWQLQTARDEKSKTVFAGKILERKLAASLATLKACLPDDRTEKARLSLERNFDKLRRHGLRKFSDLYAIEGPSARVYFRALHGMTMNWQAKRSELIPPNWLKYDARSTPLSGVEQSNAKAAHPINAMLNYAYAVLEAETRITCIKEGYDPRIGIVHRPSKNAPTPFVFDVMEPFRPVADKAVFDFAFSEKFAPKDFVLRNDGVCRLSPQLAKVVAGRVTNDLKELETGLQIGALEYDA